MLPAVAEAGVPPHVAPTGTVETDACAICHRGHTSNAGLPYRTTQSIEPTGDALIIADHPRGAPSDGDVGLCFLCHGAAGLGSNTDVESSFSRSSVHALAPAVSAFGPSPKMCGSCHDPHGSDLSALADPAVGAPAQAPYAGLLRSWVDTDTVAFWREEYCASCHKDRLASRFDSVAVYRRTGHYSGLPDPASGTRIRCSNCHEAHGSDVAPLLATTVVPPAAPDTATVAADDRGQCVACHPAARDTWSGAAGYAVSAHAVSTTTTPILGEWASASARRRVGECQVCHAPMGRGDGAGGTIPKLLEKPGRQLCDTCHGPTGPAAADLAQFRVTTAEAAEGELAIVWRPTDATASDGRVAVYSRDTTGTAPRPLIGPREYPAPAATSAAAGDINGDTKADLVMGDRVAGSLTVLERDRLLGLGGPAPSRAIRVGIHADLVVVGRFVEPPAAAEIGGPRPQIGIVDVAAGKLWLYENMTGTALSLVPGPDGDGYYDVGAGVTGIAAGEVGVADGFSEIVLTRGGVDQVEVLSQYPGDRSRLTSVRFASVASGAPRGPSIGDVAPVAGNEIVVCEPGAGTVAVFDAAGARLGAFTPDAGGGDLRVPWASAIGDVRGAGGPEIAVAMRSPLGASSLVVDRDVLPGPATEYAAGTSSLMANSGSVIVADADGDSKAETLVGNAGLWDTATGMVRPSVQVYRPNGVGGLVAAPTLAGAGTELAGEPPALIVADFGGVLPSRHPVDEVSAAHVSTETAPFARHVTCSDCHDSHEATSATHPAPAVNGPLLGAWGVAVNNTAPGTQTLDAATRADKGYEVCLKCHGASDPWRRDIASEINSLNPSVHAVESAQSSATALPDSFETTTKPWSTGSILGCSDCHGNAAGAGPKGVHSSSAAPILVKPFLGTTAESADLLCYECHLRTTYYTGSTDGAGAQSSRFFDSLRPAPPLGITATGALHALHVRSFDPLAPSSGGFGLSCSACHVSHGSATEPHLLRSDIGFQHVPPYGGACRNACHGSTPERSYTYRP